MSIRLAIASTMSLNREIIFLLLILYVSTIILAYNVKVLSRGQIRDKNVNLFEYWNENRIGFVRQEKFSHLHANPVTVDSTSYQDITEQEAFLWFDEAYIYVKAGSGGAGSSAVKFGKARQHVAPQVIPIMCYHTIIWHICTHMS